LLAQHVLVLVVGILFFGYLTVRAVQSALRSKKSSDHIMSVAVLYLVLVVSSVAVLLAVSYPFGLSFSDMVAYAVFGPVCVLFFYYRFLKKRMNRSIRKLRKRFS
jgi:ABC-type enterochelin transport system permease subunit